MHIDLSHWQILGIWFGASLIFAGLLDYAVAWHQDRRRMRTRRYLRAREAHPTCPDKIER